MFKKYGTSLLFLGQALNILIVNMKVSLYGQDYKLMSIKEDFFKDMVVHLDIWTETGVKALTEKDDDLMWSENIRSFEKIRSALAEQGVDKEDIINILSECLRGLSHSFLTIGHLY